MEFQEKIDKVLKAKQIKLWKLADLSGLKSTLEKAYEENREMRETNTDKLLQKLGISRNWWDSGKGEIFLENNSSEGDISSEKDQEIIKLLKENSELKSIIIQLMNEKGKP